MKKEQARGKLESVRRTKGRVALVREPCVSLTRELARHHTVVVSTHSRLFTRAGSPAGPKGAEHGKYGTRVVVALTCTPSASGVPVEGGEERSAHVLDHDRGLAAPTRLAHPSRVHARGDREYGGVLATSL